MRNEKELYIRIRRDEKSLYLDVIWSSRKIRPNNIQIIIINKRR